MKLYQTIDGTLIGFYKEKGGAVQALLYRDIYEKQLVTWETEERVVTPGHYERQMIWHPEYSVTRYREVPGHYEIQHIWVPEYYVTRYYWREAHPARGLEAAWIPYQHLIPAGYKDQRVWVETYTEPYQEIIPAGERETRVWVAEKVEYETVVHTELQDVWIGREPVYEYVDPEQNRMFEVGELIPDVVDVPDYKDVITIINSLTGEVLRTTARYLGMAEQIDENEYVVP